MSEWSERLRTRIAAREARTAVVGLGYVGLPLLAELARAGFRAIGIDTDQRKIASLQAGRSYVLDVPDAAIAPAIGEGRIEVSGDFDLLRDADTINICVPTPLRKSKDPDVSYILRARDAIKARMGPGKLVILESTTYPGSTEELLLPELQDGGLAVGEDFFLAFSPERVDPGNAVHTTRTIPKVVGGVTPTCTALASCLYEATVEQVVPVSSPRVAEMVKLLENTFRSVNIALANEMALLCDRMGLNVWEVIDAAATKPFGFMPFYPGPGLGGHCIPIDPFYLTWKARMTGFESRLVELAAQINASMPTYVVNLVRRALNEQRKPVAGSRILLLGVAYKENIDDLRESPALDVLRLLEEDGAEVEYHDPFVPAFTVGESEYRSVALSPERIGGYDLIVVTTAHREIDYAALLAAAPAVVDTRNALGGTDDPKLYRL